MALSADAQALLELILAKDQSYEDISGLLGVPEDEVRDRARGALTELAGTDPDAEVGLTDWLLGQADPIGRADAARYVKDDPEGHRLATELSEALREIAPEAELPRLPGQAPARRRRAAAQKQERSDAAPSERGGRLSQLSSQQTRLVAILGLAALLVVGGVIALVSGGGDDSPASSANDTQASGDPASEDTASIPLRPTSGGDAEGTLTLGVAGEQEAFMDVSARNLQPAPSGRSYAIWFMQDGKRGFPYQELPVDNSGSVDERFLLPQQLLPAAFSSNTVDVWISDNEELGRRISGALEDGSVVEVPGERVLSAPMRRLVEAAGLSGEGGGQGGNAGSAGGASDGQ